MFQILVQFVAKNVSFHLILKIYFLGQIICLKAKWKKKL